MNRNMMLALAFLIQSCLSALIFIPGVPVDQLSLLRAQVALNIWELDLMRNYGKPSENRLNIKRNTDRVNQKLHVLSQQLEPYNNVILGNSNGVAGSNNLIIGNSNTVLGNRNYVFTSGFTTLPKKANTAAPAPMSDTLVSDDWVGELGRKEEIFTNLHDVIYSLT